MRNLYRNLLKIWNLDLAKAPGSDLPKKCPYLNIGAFLEVQSRELSLRSKIKLSIGFGITLCFMLSTCCSSSAFAEFPSRLQYALGDPVRLSSEVAFEIGQAIPGLELSCSSTQRITAQLTIEAPHHGSMISQPPFDVLMRLEDFRVEAQANRESRVYGADDPGTSFLTAGISRLIDRPIRLHVDKKWNFDPNSEDLLKALNDMPVLKEIEPYRFLEGMLQPIFALAGKSLASGAKYQQKISLGTAFPLSMPINYEVVEMNDNYISAKLQGDLDLQAISLAAIADPLSKQGGKAELTLKGTMTGKALWSRTNALIFELENWYQFNGALKIGELDWPFTASVRTVFQSARTLK